MVKKRIGVLTLHSCIDIITNSSTELFCVVKGQKKVVEKVIEDVVKEMGCSAVELMVDQYEDDDGNTPRGKFFISYDRETKGEPCDHLIKMIKERLNVIEMNE